MDRFSGAPHRRSPRLTRGRRTERAASWENACFHVQHAGRTGCRRNDAMRLKSLCLSASLALAVPAFAADTLESCSARKNDTLRLACYDRLAGRVQPASDALSMEQSGAARAPAGLCAGVARQHTVRTLGTGGRRQTRAVPVPALQTRLSAAAALVRQPQRPASRLYRTQHRNRQHSGQTDRGQVPAQFQDQVARERAGRQRRPVVRLHPTIELAAL